jgi:hypothetical protein
MQEGASQPPPDPSILSHLTCAQLYENGELSEHEWDRAMHIHRLTGRDPLEILAERGKIDLVRLSWTAPAAATRLSEPPPPPEPR